MSEPSILVAGGGTGGHVYPGLAVAEEIHRRRPSVPIVFVGTRAGIETRLVPAAGYPLQFIRAGGIAGKALPARVAGALLVPVGVLQSAGLLMRNRARVVVGVGGYASGPVVTAARLLGRSTLILEQNASPGATNRILAPLVDCAAVAFAATVPRLKARRAVVTGNPVRASLTHVPDHRDASRWGLLIFGGSRGAHGLNRAVLAALPRLATADRHLSIVHQTGSADLEEMKSGYASAGVPAQVLPYIEDMAGAYAQADLVICRAGATTVAELSAVGRPAILVPFPHATAGHQEENARALVEAGAAVVLPEAEAGCHLADLALSLLHDPGRRRRMEEAARGLGAPIAARAVADLILELYDRPVRRTASGNGRPA